MASPHFPTHSTHNPCLPPPAFPSSPLCSSSVERNSFTTSHHICPPKAFASENQVLRCVLGQYVQKIPLRVSVGFLHTVLQVVSPRVRFWAFSHTRTHSFVCPGCFLASCCFIFFLSFFSSLLAAAAVVIVSVCGQGGTRTHAS